MLIPPNRIIGRAQVPSQLGVQDLCFLLDVLKS